MKLRSLSIALIFLTVHSGLAAPPAIRYTDSGPEHQLARVFAEIERNRWDAALLETEALLRAYPNFRLGHLIRGDLLLARARPLKSFGEGALQQSAELVADLRAEAIARLHAYKNKPRDTQVPRYLMQMRPDQKHAIIIDLQKSRLYIYRNDNGTPRFVADYYISHGKLGADKHREGDLKTPVGVYYVTAKIPRQRLSDFYGNAAFPLSYPNEWDKKIGKSGHGIWLHGTPSDIFSRPPKASDGCVVLANVDLEMLSTNVKVGATPVIIGNGIEWLSLDDWHSERKALLAVIDEWRRDWESLDLERYSRHYARSFSADGMNRAEWLAHKKKVNASKQWIKVSIDNVSMFRNPGKDDYVVVTFDQDYQSSNLSNRMQKRQYWIKEDGRWKIALEGAA